MMSRGHQHRSRIEGLEVLGFIANPGRKRPERRREPGVQHVLILNQFPSLQTGFCFSAGND